MSESSNLPFIDSFNIHFTQRFKAKYPQSNIYVEYLDVRKLKSSSFTTLREIITSKYQNMDVDAVVYMGVKGFELMNLDNAFAPNAGHFLMQYEQNFDASKFAKPPFVLTLQNEYQKVIMNAFEVSKADKLFVVIRSLDRLAFNSIKNIKATVQHLGLASRVEILNFTTVADISNRINSTNGNVAVLLTPFFIDVENNEYHPAMTSQYLASRINKPIFVHLDSLINEHVLGGYVISSKLLSDELFMGITQFFDNNSPVFDEANIYQYTYNEPLLNRYSIDVRSLPQHAITTNQKMHTFRQFFTEAIIAAILFTVLIILVALLIVWARMLAAQRTRLHDSEQALLRTNERLKAATDSTEIGLWEYEINSQTLVWDAWMYRHHANSTKSFNPTLVAWNELLDPAHQEEFNEALQYAIVKAIPVSFDYKITMSQSRERSLRISGQVAINLLNEPLRIVGTVVDVSNQIMHEEQLQQEREKLAQISHAKSQFISSTSHEIRTPMNVIVGATERLEKSALTSEQTELVAHINGAANNLMYMVNDILELSRIETGRLKIQKYDFNLTRFIEQLLQSFAQQIISKGLKVEVVKSPRLPTLIHSDPQRIKQVLFSLIDNAIKYTESGQITIDIDWQDNINNLDDATGLLSFAVSDTGIGIARDKRDSVFDRQERLNVETYKQYSSLGLGLHVSKEITSLLHGNLTFESEFNVGSKFLFTVPVVEVQSKAFTRGEVRSTTEPNFRNKRILIVDDVSTSRVILAQMLATSNAEIVFAENGRVAVGKCCQQHFDFIFMDILMPVMDGLEATRKIRNDVASMSRDAIIISLTTKAMEGDEQVGLNAGMNKYLTKPITREALLDCLAAYL